MDDHCHDFYNESFYRGGELTSGNIETPQQAQTRVVPEPVTAIEAKLGSADAASAEREKQLELWMEDVKLFIRGIDVSKL